MNIVSQGIADVMLWLMYIAIVVARMVTAYSVWHGLRFRRKGDDVVNGIVAIGFVLCMVLTFAFGSTKPIISNGQMLTDTFWLRVADMFIYTSIILIIGCFVSAIVSRFRS